jgi:wyosine [tRNA(Phe)-imidazoG37] synthetase (radical SAM superfamily)
MIRISDALQILRPGAEWSISGNLYSNLEWLDKSQTKPTEEEINKKVSELENAEPYKLLREERNKLIAETDWTQLKDISLDSIREKNWKEYRQALRDLPNGSTPKLDSFGDLDMSSVNWPDKPST